MKYANISNKPCDNCHKLLVDWDYKYQGKHYCKECFNLLFTFQICSICGKRKKISNDLQVPICKVCQVKNKPCIRCNRNNYKFGLITKDGPVCKTCAVYFREYKTCSVCHSAYYTVSERKLLNGMSQLLCHRCYNKILPICCLCQKQRKAYKYDENHRAICELCAIKQNKQCLHCGEIISAGRGNLCKECTYMRTLIKRIYFGKNTLSEAYISLYFEQFGWWLKDRRGVLFAAVHLLNYLPYFSQIDTLCERLGRIPIYKEIVENLSVVMSRKNLLVTTFLNDTGLVPINKQVQEEQANLDMIERYLNYFNKGSWEAKILKEYYIHLSCKMKHRSTIRSIRLALGTAAKVLEYKHYFTREYLTNEVVEGYLWKYPGQKSSLIGFIAFLKKRGFDLEIGTKKQFKSPDKSALMLKRELISHLTHSKKELKFFQKAIRAMIGYLHNIDIPTNVIISQRDIKVGNQGIWLSVAKAKFYLPKEVKFLF